MSTLRVKNLAETRKALRRVERDVRLAFDEELRSVAQPVADDAQRLASGSIRNLGDAWSRMRVGVISRGVYVAPKQRGVGRRGDRSRSRPNLAGRLMDEAMQPALDRNAGETERRFDDALGRVVNNFSR